MKKIIYLSILILASGCTKLNTGPNGEVLINPANAKALSEVLIFPNGSEVLSGNPPAASNDSEAPITDNPISSVSAESGTTVPLDFTFDNVNGNLGGCYIQVAGADTYINIPYPNNTSGSNGSIQLPLGIPENVDQGQFCVNFSVYDENGLVSNSVSTCIKVTASPTGNSNEGSWKLQFQKKYLDISTIDFYDENRGIAVGRTSWEDSEGFSRSEYYGLYTNDGGETWNEGALPENGIGAQSAFNLDGNNIWSCGTYGTVDYSPDGGRTWQEQLNGDYGPSYYQFNDIFFIDENQGWISTGSQAVSGKDAIGQVLYTSNGGASWHIIHEDPSDNPFREIQMINDRNGFAVTGAYQKNKIMKTNDGGANWSIAFSAETNHSLSSFHIFDQNNILAIGISLVDNVRKLLLINSSDGGNSWTVNEPIGFSAYNLDFSDDRNGYIVGRDKDFEPSILSTNDGGETWKTDKSIEGFSNDVYDQFSWFTGISATSDGSAWVSGNDGRIYKRE